MNIYLNPLYDVVLFQTYFHKVSMYPNLSSYNVTLFQTYFNNVSVNPKPVYKVERNYILNLLRSGGKVQPKR